MARTNERGFGIVEIVMAIVIVVLLGAVVYMFVQNNQKKDQVHSTAPSPSMSVSASPTPSTSVADEQSTVLSHVKAFYQKWLNVVNDPSGYPTSQWVKDGYVTQAAASEEDSVREVDTATCSQNPLTYSEYTFSTPKISNATGSLTISGTYPGMSGSSKTTTIGIDIIKDGSIWKINKFNCHIG